MSDEIKPALSIEEWNDRDQVLPYSVEYHGEANEFVEVWECRAFAADALRPERRHAIAALALDEQAFGFTWDDVHLIRDAVVVGFFDGGGYEESNADTKRRLSLAARIAALLRPEPIQYRGSHGGPGDDRFIFFGPPDGR